MIRKDIGENLKVLDFQRELKVRDPDVALAKFIRFLTWVGRRRPDGVVIRPGEDLGLVTKAIEDACGWRPATGKNIRRRGQFVEALMAVGILVRDDRGGWLVNDWDEINEPTFRIAQHAEWKRQWRLQRAADQLAMEVAAKPLECLSSEHASEHRVHMVSAALPSNYANLRKFVHGPFSYTAVFGFLTCADSGPSELLSQRVIADEGPDFISTTTHAFEAHTQCARPKAVDKKQGLTPLVVVVKKRKFSLGEIPGDWSDLDLDLNDPGDALVHFLWRHRCRRPRVPPGKRDRFVPSDWEAWHFNAVHKHDTKGFEYLVESYLDDDDFVQVHWRASTMTNENVCESRLAEYHLRLQEKHTASDLF